MASPMWCEQVSRAPVSSMWVKPDNGRNAGRGQRIRTLRVAGLSIEASRAVYRVDQVAADLVHVLSGEFAFQNVDFSSGRRSGVPPPVSSWMHCAQESAR